MMRVRIPFQGEMCDGEEVEFTATKEDWNVYECEDGTRVKIRFIVGKIVRLLDKRTDQGEPHAVGRPGDRSVPRRGRRRRRYLGDPGAGCWASRPPPNAAVIPPSTG